MITRTPPDLLSQLMTQCVLTDREPTSTGRVNGVGGATVWMTYPPLVVAYELDWMRERVDVLVGWLATASPDHEGPPSVAAWRELDALLRGPDRAHLDQQRRAAYAQGGLRGMAWQIDASSQAFERAYDLLQGGGDDVRAAS